MSTYIAPFKVLTIAITKRCGLAFCILLLSACAAQSTLERHQTKADEGNIEHQLLLADSYFYGTKDLARDSEMAIKYYRLATDNGSDSAAFKLGVIYQKLGNFDESIHYYELAADAGNASAQDNLAILYQYGTGVEKNTHKAEQLYLQALSNGSRFSLRNLAILYRDNKQIDKAIEAFTQLVFAPTEKDNSKRFKSAVAQELMDLYLMKQDKRNAYIWGATAILSGLFDSKINDTKDKLERYESTKDTINEGDKKALSQFILLHHYKAFQQYETAIKKHQAFLISNGIIDLPTEELVGLVAYKTQIKKDIYQGINQFKDQEDKKSHINLALYKLRLASYEVSIGAISPHFLSAKSNIEQSMSILQKYNDSNLASLKRHTLLKLDIIKHIASYQQATLTTLK